MRLLFLLILLAGVGIGAIYPWSLRNFSGAEIGTWRVYENGQFKPQDVQLKSTQAPVRVLVDLTTNTDRILSSDRAVLTLTADHGGKTALASTLKFRGNPTPREQSPQITDRIFRDEAGLIPEVSDGAYTFTVGQGDADDIQIKAVDLVLRSGAQAIDPRLQPIGFSLIAIGFIGLVLAFRHGRGGRPENPNSQPPPRWGRGGGSSS
ncbi:hypothetical protein [Mesorhizobium sp. A623]